MAQSFQGLTKGMFVRIVLENYCTVGHFEGSNFDKTTCMQTIKCLKITDQRKLNPLKISHYTVSLTS